MAWKDMEMDFRVAKKREVGEGQKWVDKLEKVSWWRMPPQREICVHISNCEKLS